MAAESLSERLRGVGLELADISSEYANLARSSNMDESQIETVRRKMTDWLGLCRKFGNSVESVLSARREMAAKIENQSDVRATMEKLRRRADELLESLAPIADKILKAREKAAKKLAERASKTLLGLGFKMPDSAYLYPPSLNLRPIAGAPANLCLWQIQGSRFCRSQK